MDDSIINLLYGGNSPEEKGRASALAAALRKQKQFGEMALLLRDPYLTQYGNSLIGDAAEQQNRLYKAPQDRNTLDRGRQALMDEKFKYQQGVEEDQRLKGRPEVYSQNLSTKLFRGVDPNTTTQGDFERNAKIAAQLRGDDQSYWARMAAANRERSDALGYRKGIDNEKSIQKLGDDLRPISAILEDIPKLNRLAEDEDAAGFGPLVGRIAPDIAVSDEGQDNRQVALRSMQNLVYLKSGKAITQDEAGRILTSYGLSKSAPAHMRKQGARRLIEEMKQAAINAEAKYPKEIRDIYKSRGGVTSKDFALPDAQNQPPNKVRSFVRNGKKYEIEGDKIYEVD